MFDTNTEVLNVYSIFGDNVYSIVISNATVKFVLLDYGS